MVKYIYAKSNQLIKFDKDTENISSLNNIVSNINWIWVADEDGVLNDEEVKAGDVIISFYEVTGDGRRVIVVKDQKVKDFYKELSDYYKMRKLERQATKCCDCACCECECETAAN